MPNNSNTLAENYTTVGIEIETEFIPQANSPSLSEFRVTHDASIESDEPFLTIRNIKSGDNSYFYGDIPEKIRNLFGSGFLRLGVEYYSNILNPNALDLEKLLKDNMELLYLAGEQVGIRSGIHFHVSLSTPQTYVLRNLTKIFLRYEDLIFKLSGLGKVNRGVFNSSAYSRPLSQGIYVPSNGGYYPIINYDDLFATKTAKDFFNVWGDSNTQSGTRYFPARYLVLNLAPILFRGAVEYRPCNTTLNYKWIYGMLEFFRNITKLAASERSEKISNIIMPVENKRPLSDLYTDLVELLYFCQLDDKISYIIEDIFSKTPTMQLPRENLRSHLEIRSRVNSHWQNCTYKPNPLTVLDSTPKVPKIDDIHSRGG